MSKKWPNIINPIKMIIGWILSDLLIIIGWIKVDSINCKIITIIKTYIPTDFDTVKPIKTIDASCLIKHHLSNEKFFENKIYHYQHYPDGKKLYKSVIPIKEETFYFIK